MSTRTAVFPAPVQTAESAALRPLAATHAPVLRATKVLAASTTRTNAPPRPQYARMKAAASTPPAPTSENLVYKEGRKKSDVCKI